jgi:hypothetical protein
MCDTVESGLETEGPAVALCMVGESGFMLFADAFEDSETSKLDWEVNSVFACAAVRMMQTVVMVSVQDVPGWGTRRRRERHCWETFGDVFYAFTEPEPSENGRSLDVTSRT